MIGGEMVKFTKILKKHNLAATIAHKIAQTGARLSIYLPK